MKTVYYILIPEGVDAVTVSHSDAPVSGKTQIKVSYFGAEGREDNREVSQSG